MPRAKRKPRGAQRGPEGAVGPETEGARPAVEFDEEALLHNAAGQVYRTEKMDRISDEAIEQLQLDQMILNEMGERKHRKKILP